MMDIDMVMDDNYQSLMRKVAERERSGWTLHTACIYCLSTKGGSIVYAQIVVRKSPPAAPCKHEHFTYNDTKAVCCGCHKDLTVSEIVHSLQGRK